MYGAIKICCKNLCGTNLCNWHLTRTIHINESHREIYRFMVIIIYIRYKGFRINGNH